MFNVENPSEMMKMSLAFVKNKVNKICGLFNVEFTAVEKWLIENRSEQYQKTEKLYQAVNNNIYGKWLEGKAQEFELRTWSNVITQWKESWIELLKQYWKANQKKK